MRSVLSIKTLFRAPLKTIATFLLIAAAAFALFSRVTDYAVTSREMDSAVGYYRGVAALDNSQPASFIEVNTSSTYGISVGTTAPEPSPWPTNAQIAEFSSLPGVTVADTRYMTAGRIDGLSRMFTGWDYATFVVEGTFAGYAINPLDPGLMEYTLTDINMLAGDFTPEPIETFTFGAFLADSFDGILENPFGQTFADSLSEGSRVLVIGTHNSTDPGSAFLFSTGLTDFHVIDGLQGDYLDLDESAHIREIIEVANNDRTVFDIVYTQDMRSIMQFNEREMIIMQGRELVLGDTDGCVVSQDFLFSNNLSLGDKLTISLGDRLFTQSGWGAQSLAPESRSDFIEMAELEIIGVYRYADSSNSRPGWVYTVNAIFVPTELLPVTPPAEHELSPSEFSVLIEDVYEIDAFLENAIPMSEEMNIAMLFSDRGWSNMKDSINSSLRATLMTAALYICVGLLALLLAVYLHISQKRKDFAIMRALGTTIRKSRKTLTLPLLVLSALAVPIGGFAGLFYTARTIAVALEGLSGIDGYAMNTSLPVAAVAFCLFFQLAFILLCATIFLNKLGKTPPLALLQGDIVRLDEVAAPEPYAVSEHSAISGFAPAPNPASVTAPAPETCAADTLASFQKMPRRGRYTAFSHVSRYIFRHMRRVGWKTAIPLALAIALISAMGLLAITRQTYEDAFSNVDVTCRITNFSSSSINALTRSELVENLHAVGSFTALVNGTNHITDIKSTNDLERYLSGLMAGNYSIEFAEGFSDTSFFADGSSYILLGSAAANTLDVKPGDSISLVSTRVYDILSQMLANSDGYDPIEAEGELAGLLIDRSISCIVAGVIDSENQTLNEFVFSPLSRAAEAVYGQPFPVQSGELTLSDNTRLNELSSLLERQTTASLRYASGVSFYMDTMELENIMRVRDLIILLFPIAVLGASLIGLTAPALLILQSSKEAAILRILGTTKKRVMCMLFFEQFILCISGIILAASGLAIYNSGFFARDAQTLALCAALYLTGCTCAALAASASVTRRKVLELLQVKE